MKETGLEMVTKWFENNLQLILIVSALLAVFLPWLLSREAYSDYFAIPNGVGSTIGGISQTILGVVTVILIFLTYRSQKEEFYKLTEQANFQNKVALFNAALSAKNELLSKVKLIESREGIYTYMDLSHRFHALLEYDNISWLNNSPIPNSKPEGGDFNVYLREYNSRYTPLDFFYKVQYATELNLLIEQTDILLEIIETFKTNSHSESINEKQNVIFNILSASFTLAEKELLYFYKHCIDCPDRIKNINNTFFTSIKQSKRTKWFENTKSSYLKDPSLNF